MLVKIKTWEAMRLEYGLDNDGDIACDRSFTKNMESFLPANRIINVDAYNYWNKVAYNYWDRGAYDSRAFRMSDDMIEEYFSKYFTIYGETVYTNLAKSCFIE